MEVVPFGVENRESVLYVTFILVAEFLKITLSAS
jgi:hypothetical protein